MSRGILYRVGHDCRGHVLLQSGATGAVLSRPRLSACNGWDCPLAERCDLLGQGAVVVVGYTYLRRGLGAKKRKRPRFETRVADKKTISASHNLRSQNVVVDQLRFFLLFRRGHFLPLLFVTFVLVRNLCTAAFPFRPSFTPYSHMSD